MLLIEYLFLSFFRIIGDYWAAPAFSIDWKGNDQASTMNEISVGVETDFFSHQLKRCRW